VEKRHERQHGIQARFKLNRESFYHYLFKCQCGACPTRRRTLLVAAVAPCRDKIIKNVHDDFERGEKLRQK